MVQDFYSYTKFLEPKLWVVSTLWKEHKYTFFSGPYFRIWTEYEDLLLKSLYSVRIRENTDQKNSVFAHFTQYQIMSKKTSSFLWCLIGF